jgi:hypothetical protein
MTTVILTGLGLNAFVDTSNSIAVFISNFSLIKTFLFYNGLALVSIFLGPIVILRHYLTRLTSDPKYL